MKTYLAAIFAAAGLQTACGPQALSSDPSVPARAYFQDAAENGQEPAYVLSTVCKHGGEPVINTPTESSAILTLSGSYATVSDTTVLGETGSSEMAETCTTTSYAQTPSGGALPSHAEVKAICTADGSAPVIINSRNGISFSNSAERKAHYENVDTQRTEEIKLPSGRLECVIRHTVEVPTKGRNEQKVNYHRMPQAQ